MRKDGPGISGLSQKTLGIKSLQEKVAARIKKTPNQQFMFEASQTANNEHLEKNINTAQQNLIMTPAYKKQQARCENEIKRLDDLIKDAKAKGDDEQVTKFETQKELYKQQIEDCQRKIEEEQAKALDPKNGLAGETPNIDSIRKADEEATLEAMRNETIQELKKQAVKEPIKGFGLAD